MDTTQTVTHISLCAGYGGIDLGLRGAIPNLRTVAFSEIEGFACANLVSKMESGLLDCAPIWTDLKTFPWRAFRDRVDILSGGYPCQPFSAAGKRLGTDDPRHLWPFIANGIRLLRPRLCFFENVEGHISLGLREVISELESMGYKVSWGIFSAREVGAPHQRKRVFILAMANSARDERSEQKAGDWRSLPARGSTALWPSRPGQPQYAFEPPRVVANSASQRANAGHQLCGEECGQGRALPLQSDDSGEGVGNADCLDRGTSASGWIDDAEAGSASEDGSDMANARSVCGERPDPDGICGREICESPRRDEVRSEDSGCGESDGGEGKAGEPEWKAKPSLGGDANGTARGMDYAELCVTCDNRTDELRLLGNGVVPATATLAFRTLLAELLNL